MGWTKTSGTGYAKTTTYIKKHYCIHFIFFSSDCSEIQQVDLLSRGQKYNFCITSYRHLTLSWDSNLVYLKMLNKFNTSNCFKTLLLWPTILRNSKSSTFIQRTPCEYMLNKLFGYTGNNFLLRFADILTTLPLFHRRLSYKSRHF